MPVAQTLFRISNGFLYIVRLGDDGCTTEELPALTRSSASDPFEGVASPLPSGDYLALADSPITTSESGALMVAATRLTTCENVDCNGPCERIEDSTGFTCRCNPQDLGEFLAVQNASDASACEERFVLRPWWQLLDSILSVHIQNG